MNDKAEPNHFPDASNMVPQTSAPDHHEWSILESLSDTGGWTSGQIARNLGHQDARKHGAIIRCRLLEMEQRGWVERLDSSSPVAWVRTEQGRNAIHAA